MTRLRERRTDPALDLDKFAKDYERKSRQSKKRADAHNDDVVHEKGRPGQKGRSRYGSKSIGRAKSELKSAEQIRKARSVAEKRKQKNARLSHKRGKR